MGYILVPNNIWVLVDKGTQHFILLHHHFALSFNLSHSCSILGKILFSFILPDNPVEADHQKASGIHWSGEHSLPLLSFFPLCFFLLLPYPFLSSPCLFFLPSLLPFFCLKHSPEIGPRIKRYGVSVPPTFWLTWNKSLLSGLCFPIWKRKG